MKKLWSTDEINLLKQIYENSSPEEIITTFLPYGRNWHAIKLKAFKLKLNRVKLDVDESQVIKDYLNKKYEFQELLNYYGLSSTSFYRILGKHNIKPLRNKIDVDKNEFKEDYQLLDNDKLKSKYSAFNYGSLKALASREKIKRPKEFIVYNRSNLYDHVEQLKHMYEVEKLNQKEITDFFGKTYRGTVRKILKEEGVTFRSLGEIFRKYKVNQDYFEIIDEAKKAYFLGLLAADGCVYKDTNCISLSLHEKDKQIIEEFREALSSDLPIHLIEFETTNSDPQYRICIHSSKMKEDLIKHNIIPLKSLILEFPTTLPENLISHFVRGMMDGDGCVFFSEKHSNYLSFVSTFEFINKLDYYIKEQLGDVYSTKYQVTDKNTWKLFYNRKEDFLKIYNWLYTEPPFLNRKHEKFLSILKELNVDSNLYCKDIFSYSKEELNNLSGVEKSKVAYLIFQHYRKVGFPYISLSREKNVKLFQELITRDYSKYLINNELIPSNTAIKNLWGYFPNLFETSCEGAESPLSCFNDDKKFKEVINERISYADRITDNTVRRGFKMRSTTRVAYNFRPTAAASLYLKYGGSGVVYDSSAGFGGRLLGAFLTNKIHTYIGVEPASKTFEGLNLLREDVLKVEESPLKSIELHKTCSELFRLPKESVDMCFTSPPYFDTEHYSNEPTQSYLKYTSAEAWEENFLIPTLSYSIDALKQGGYILINIKNVRNFLNLEARTQSILSSFNLIQHPTIKMLFPVLPQLQSIKGIISFEPVFVFEKRVTPSP